MSILLLDAGNSRIKWALAEDGVWLRQGVLDNARAETLRVIFAQLPPPRRILASNVAGQEMVQRLHAACGAWPCPIEFIAAQAEQCGVRNTYERPAQLGSDRWAALIAAWHQQRASCLVVNCGTATTLDALSAEGEFIGGLILPGVDMMRRSLAASAAPLVVAGGDWREFLRTTADAVFSGAIQATVGAIRLQFAALAMRGGVNSTRSLPRSGLPDFVAARCLLSGGAADSVQPHLDLPLLRVDDLVLRGLQIIGQEAEAQ